MTTRPLLMVYFAAGLAFIGFAQVYLLRKFYHLMWRSPLRPRLRQILFGAMCAFVALMYMPYPLRILYKWPEQEVSAVVLYSLLYPFSLWGMISVSTFLIVLVRDLGVTVFHPLETWVSCTWAVGQTPCRAAVHHPQGVSALEFRGGRVVAGGNIYLRSSHRQGAL